MTHKATAWLTVAVVVMISLVFLLASCAPTLNRQAPRPPVWGERPGEIPAPANNPEFTERLLFGPYDVQPDNGFEIRRR